MATARRSEMLVSMNFPEPTYISDILKAMSQWSGRAFVLEPTHNRKMQIFSARLMPCEEAYLVFVGALSTVGLRAVESAGIIKIVPMQTLIMV
jgi:hypothetical protein